ncbi:MAG: hypothetical protein K2N26_07755 [Oscillospiraceae bacterium]|nr:hypothetical protein [Oscillospiraceae bacterium]
MDFINETQKIILKNTIGGLGTVLLWFIQKALQENEITLYEAFQLMEISNRYRNRDKFWADIYHVVESMNLALCAKLFNEDDMYKRFCSDANERLGIWFKVLKKSNDGELPKDGHYITDDLEGFLGGDLKHMEKLSSVRKKASRSNLGYNAYHFECFPYDYLKYEDKLIKILNGETDHYEVDKTISPEVCDMMTAIELRAIELE